MEYKHVPVLLNEVLSGLNLKEGACYVDCTLGGAGYSTAIAQAIGEKAKLIAIDADALAIDNAKKIFKKEKIDNVVLVHNNFRHLKDIIEELGIREGVSGIVLDLGLSSAQLDDESRGFSFQGKRPLNMAFGVDGVETEHLLNTASINELSRIFREYGEEPRAYHIARAIHKQRLLEPIKDTETLVNIITTVSPLRKGQKIHPATKIFQALRIATNDEFNSLKEVLEAARAVLLPGGRLVVVSFHSGEDRLVKNYLRHESRDCVCPPNIPLCVCQHQASFKIINKKPITATIEELENNPRSRSAKLRIAEKI